MNLFLGSQGEVAAGAALIEAHSDKIPNRKRAKSTARDAHFYQDFRALWERRPTMPGMGTSVTYPTPNTPLPSYSQTPHLSLMQFDRYMGDRLQPLAALPGPTYRSPAVWRDLSFPMSALYFHFAAASTGSALAFTLRLDTATDALARQKPSAASFLQDRIATELRKAFGRRVEFWFVVENAHTGARGLHLHGELVLAPEDAAEARKALRRAGGVWERVRQHQAHTREAPDAGWVSYVLKDEVWNRKGWRFAHMRGFAGNHHAATKALRYQASRLYEADRTDVRSL